MSTSRKLFNRFLSLKSLLAFILIILFSQNVFAQRDYYFRDSTIYPINNNLSFIAGKRILYKNQNGIITKLKDFSIQDDSTFYIRDVDFINEQKVYVLLGSMYISNETFLYQTTNGGLSFDIDTSYYKASLYKSINQVQFLDNNTIALFDGYYESSVIRSFDGGKTWDRWLNSMVAHYFQLHRCNNIQWYLIGLPGDGFSSYSFPIPDSLWVKNGLEYTSGCHNGAPNCVRVFREGDQDRKTNFIAKQIDTLTKICGNMTVIQEPIKEKQISCYPNPVEEILNVSGILNEPYSIVNLSGVEIESGLINELNYSINLQNLPSGLYMLRIGNRQVKILKK